MKTKLVILVASLLSVVPLMAVPAYPGWQTKIQPDGTMIEVRLHGDEIYHYWTNRSGQVVEEDTYGYWNVVGESPAPATVAHLRKMSPRFVNRPERVGAINLAPRGLVILVNFADVAYQPSNSQAEMDKMMNADSYTYNGAYGSARKYFSDQSNGAYVPVFDVVGPVTLAKDCAYYGENDSRGTDKHPGDMVVEACKLAKSEFNVDFTLYDNNHDKQIDFVYILYAGKGEADGGAETTIWPHNHDLYSSRYYGYCTYSIEECKVDGLLIDDYACSAELNGWKGERNGIGTFCHEFGHVLGLPDYYDRNYGTNFNEGRTPDNWDVMDVGSYNGNGNYPPNYSIHEKYFFGWQTPVNLGAVPSALTLKAVGTEGSMAYQINTSNTLLPATNETPQYYIENRQQIGWDLHLPGHGLLVWYVKFDENVWRNNDPNSTAESPYYTIVSATGNRTNLGTAADPFPGTSNVNHCTIAGKPVTQIEENNGDISLIYIKDPNSAIWDYEVAYDKATVSSESGTVNRNAALQITIIPDEGYIINSAEHLEVVMGGIALTYGVGFTYADNVLTIPSVIGDIEIYVMPVVKPVIYYTVVWVTDGVVLEQQDYSENELLRFPSADVVTCEGRQFVGWTQQAGYYDPFAVPADLFSDANARIVDSNLVFYAVYKD